MRESPLLLLLFVFYCIEMGTFLLLWPWSGTWDSLWMQVPWYHVRVLGLTALFRSVVAGFGMVHLVWGAHDLDLWLLMRRRRRAETKSSIEPIDAKEAGPS